MCEYIDKAYYCKPERFEYYRQVLADDLRYSKPDSWEYRSAQERMQILDNALASIPAQRRIVTFSRGACALRLNQEEEFNPD